MKSKNQQRHIETRTRWKNRGIKVLWWKQAESKGSHGVKSPGMHEASGSSAAHLVIRCLLLEEQGEESSWAFSASVQTVPEC